MKIVLDLFCCEGGAARGYQNAGFTVLGVDLLPKFQKRYAGDGFLAMDALEALRTLIRGGSLTFSNGQTITLKDIAFIHLSPPCQAYSVTKNSHSTKHPELIEPARALAIESGLPYVIENVVGAPLLDPITLCWTMFYTPGSVQDTDGTPLQMFRHRLFESNFIRTTPGACEHVSDMQVAGSYGGARRDKWEARHVRKGGYVPAKEIQQELLGIDWMTVFGMYQSLPPVYTEWIGHEFTNIYLRG